MKTMSRDKISMEAYKISRDLSAKADAARNTSAEPKLWGLVGEADRLNNDCCEAQHTKKSLLSRLAALRNEVAA